MIDLYRKILDLSIQSCRLYQSKATSFVHDTPEQISLYTNFLFALSLLRQKTQESIQEAKFALDRLLYFQQESGNFPHYMHDFPVCRDHNNAAKILVPLYWIRKEFSHILGDTLSKRLTASFDAAQKFAELHPNRTKKPYDAMTPTEIAEAILAAQMQGEATPEFREFLSRTWHAPSKKYCGDASTLQLGFQPEVTLYDYFMGYFSDNPSEAILKPQLAAISAALVSPVKIPLDHVEQAPWSIQLRKSSEPMTLIAGVHTALLSLPGGVVESQKEGTIVMQLSEEILPDNIEKADALSFFVDALPDTSVSVNGQKSTTFHLSDTLDVAMGSTRLQLKFQLEGAPEFIGHIMKGNRPRQRLHDRAYDWQILIRKVRGEGAARLTLTYSVTHAE